MKELESPSKISFVIRKKSPLYCVYRIMYLCMTTIVSTREAFSICRANHLRFHYSCSHSPANIHSFVWESFIAYNKEATNPPPKKKTGEYNKEKKKMPVTKIEKRTSQLMNVFSKASELRSARELQKKNKIAVFPDRVSLEEGLSISVILKKKVTCIHIYIYFAAQNSRI